MIPSLSPKPRARRAPGRGRVRRPLALEPLEARALLAANFQFALGLASQDIRPNAVATDSAGNSVVAGSFFGTVDFAPGTSVAGDTLTSAGNRDIFVAKYSPQGHLLWAQRFGSSGDDDGLGVAIGPGDSVYLTGSVAVGNGVNLSVVKLSAAGAVLAGQTTTPGAGFGNIAQGVGIAVDGAGNAYLTGQLQGTQSFGTTTLASVSNFASVFVAKLDPNLNFTWAERVGNGAQAFGQAIGVDTAGNIYYAGSFSGTINLNPRNGVQANHVSNGSQDMFVSKLDPNGALVWAQSIGGPGFDDVYSLKLDGSNNLYLAGPFNGTVDFNPSPNATGNLTAPGTLGFYVLKLDSNANFAGANQLGVSVGAPLVGRWGGVAVDAQGNVYATGAFTGTANIGGTSYTAGGNSDVFVARLDPSLAIVDSARLGGAQSDTPNSISVSPQGVISSVGTYFSNPFAYGNQTLAGSGATNAYVTQLTLGTTVVHHAVFNDYDGDGKSDLAVYRPTTGEWLILQTTAGGRVVSFGQPNVDMPVAGDYDGDGKTDLAVYRPTTGQWFIQYSGGGSNIIQFGQANVDIPVQADYDGDGKTDLAVFRPTDATWHIAYSGGGSLNLQFGGSDDLPVPADYDGDGKADIAMYRQSTAMWYIQQSSAGFLPVQFGQPGVDQPTPADFNNDGKTDFSVYRPTTGTFYALLSGGGSYVVQFGQPNVDIPIISDYNGDGKLDLAVFRPPTAFFYVLYSRPDGGYPGGSQVIQFGQAGVDQPLAAPFAYRYMGSLRRRS